ncbi:granzyme B-like [Cavia porcellus]|uniref:granzyme B-like n=1 Tax=Cavia porcellus TaxID=10141 RepID=UPI002FE1AA45
MLLKLEKKAKLTKAVQLLRLPKGRTEVNPGTQCQVAGWGTFTPEGTYPETLQEVEMIVLKDEKCEELFPKYYDRATEICVGDPKIKNTLLKGDSGGPLVCNNVAHFLLWMKEWNNTMYLYQTLMVFTLDKEYYETELTAHSKVNPVYEQPSYLELSLESF